MTDAANDPIRAFLRVFDTPEHQPFRFDTTHDSPAGAALLVHGFPGTPSEMRPLGEALHAVGWMTEGILLPGFGSDIATMGDRRLEDWATAVESALDRLTRDHRRVILVGNSLGGALSIRAASRVRGKSLIGLVLLCPFWRLENALWGLLPVIRRVVPQIKPFNLMKIDLNDPETRTNIGRFMPDADFDSPEVQAAMRNFAIPTSIFAEIRRSGMAAWDAAPQVGVKTLIIQGKRDQLVTPATSRKIAGRLGAAYYEVDGEHDLVDAGKPAWDAVSQRVVAFASDLVGARP